jgi:oxygen-independent coproporphyrinogen-3 oxidase
MLSTSGPSAHSVYIHIPFCKKRCSYCDFNTYAGIESLLSTYVNALCQEIVQVTSANSTQYPVHTVFFGGGTPSLLKPNQLEMIMKTLDESFDLSENAEISMEANPGTIVDGRLKDFHALGINRLSFGMQSAKDQELKLLGRIHSHQDTVNSIQSAREAGYGNLNLDLIYNLPGQTMQDWQENLQAALLLAPEHISLYSLTIEEGTLLHQQIHQGIYTMPEDDHAADMMQETIMILDKAGYVHYEISNWAKLDSIHDYQCRHNRQYWKNQPYFGFGAGAHGLVDNFRTINTMSPALYIKQCNQAPENPFPTGPATTEVNQRTRNEEIEDHMILNLRLLQEGVNLAIFRERFNSDIFDIYPEEINSLLASGHLIWSKSRQNLCIPPEHFFIANQILVNFLLDEDQ